MVFLTAKKRGKTGVFKEVRRGFAEVKLEIQTAIPSRQYHGKCTNTFERYCNSTGEVFRWPKWIQRFERFRKATGLDKQSDENQVNTLIYTLGEQADDIFISFEFTAEQEKSYEEVKENSKITSS